MCDEDEEFICQYNCGALTTVDIALSSLSPESVFDRILNHYDELGLSEAQIKRILDLRRQYVKDYIAIMVEFAKKALEVETLIHQDDPADDEQINEVLAQRGKIFVSHERLFVNAVKRVRIILSSEQQAGIGELYIRERRMKFEGLETLISSSFAPVLELRKAEDSEE